MLLPALLLAAAAGLARGAPTEQVVTDLHTGLAIDGFDPVAYFIDQAAEVGRADFELRYREVVWRFRNPGNRAAFVDSPDDYEPRFGGYDAIAVGRGAPTPGNPRIWLVVGHQLYLFYSNDARDAFQADPAEAAARAEAKWPQVQHLLAR